MKLRLITFCGTDYDHKILPSFIKHYYNLGVEDILITLQSNEDGKNIEEAKHVCKSFGIEPYDLWIGEYTSQEMYERRLDAIEYSNPDWVIHADIDELHEWPEDLIETLRATKANAVQGVFVDWVSANGDLCDIQSDVCIKEQFPINCNLMQKWIFGKWSPPTGLVKMMAYKPGLDVSRGGHVANSPKTKYIDGRDLSGYPDIYTTSRKVETKYKVHHFKWHKETVDKLKRRVRVYKEKDYGWWRQSQNFLDYLDRNNGKINIEGLELI